MRILALQPYDAGSHRAFLQGWQRNSAHHFETIVLPGRHFKWRMRQAPLHFARQIDALSCDGKSWDILWCTSMLDLAALRGLCPAAALPCVVYFHENQFTYPVRHEQQRDLHFAMTNMTTALAAASSVCNEPAYHGPPCIWWNSSYNRDSFLQSLEQTLESMPDHRPEWAEPTITRASGIFYPGIDTVGVDTEKQLNKPPTLLWAARWEHDKGPELFFDSLAVLEARGVDFRISVIGQQFAEEPACFKQARQRFASRIDRWGFQESRADYESALRQADLIVSTSRHEFFGLAVAEAVSAGCVPVLPDALAYPEVWGQAAVYHDQTPSGVADAIEQVLNMPCRADRTRPADRYAWSIAAPKLDSAINALVRR